MYCPKCGKQVGSEQKFCRSCGFSLQEVSRLLAESPSEAETDQIPLQIDEPGHSRRNKLVRWGFFTSVVGLGFLFSMTAIFLTDMFLIDLGPRAVVVMTSLMGIGLPIFLVGLSLIGYWAYLSLPKTLPSQPLPQPTSLPETAATAKLSAEVRHGPVASVTEHTTDLLETSGESGRAPTKARQRE